MTALTIYDTTRMNAEIIKAFLANEHTHTPAFPVFTERRSDGIPILTAYRCLCGTEVRVDYLGA